MDKISFKEDSTMTWQNGKPIILHKYSISKELIDIIENENNFNTINHALCDLHVEHMIDGSKSIIAMPIQDYQTQTSVIKAFEDAKNKHDRLIVLFQRLLECANEAKRQEQKSISAKKDEHQCNEDHEGMYYQKDRTFQKERDKNSWGLCIISNYKEDVIMSLEDLTVTYKEAINESLPFYLEIITASFKFKAKLNLSKLGNYWIKPYGTVIDPDFRYIAVRKFGSASDYGVGYIDFDHDSDYRLPRLCRNIKRISKV